MRHLVGGQVCIITPYDAQKRLLALSIWHVAISIVDAFRGQDKDLILLSTVRTGGVGTGFVGDDRRLNVAVTRAKRGLLPIWGLRQVT